MRATLETAIDRLVGAELDHVEVRAEAAAVLRRHLSFDVAVWATVDPVTVMWTHCLLDGFDRDEQLERRIFTNEYGEDDVVKLQDLLRTSSKVGSIATATGGEPCRSPRLTEILGPLGFGDEARLLFVDAGTPWGVLHLLRGEPFTSEELEILAAIGERLALGLRLALVRGAVTGSGLSEPPGVIELQRDGLVADVSPEAVALLGSEQVPQVVASVVARHRSGSLEPASWARPDGRWLSFFATTLAGRRAVIVEPAGSARLAEIIVRARGLTRREREIVEQVAYGRSTRAIADALHISEWTVQDHLKSVFAKFGVASRAELVAAVFFGHYLPEHEAGTTPSPRGWYLGR